MEFQQSLLVTRRYFVFDGKRGRFGNVLAGHASVRVVEH